MRKRCALPVVALIVLLGAAPMPATPGAADPTPLDCSHLTQTPGPLVGDGLRPGDAPSAASPLTYGCYSGELDDEGDIDGYNVYGTPVRVYVGLRDEHADCARVTWYLGPPPSNGISKRLCDHEGHEVEWHGTYPVRLHLWHESLPIDGPTTYRIGVRPAP